MVKRSKRLKKPIESLKKQIEKHFDKLEKEIESDKRFLARYHVKEIESSLIDSLENKMGLLGKKDNKLLKKYKNKLEKIKKKMSFN